MNIGPRRPRRVIVAIEMDDGMQIALDCDPSHFRADIHPVNPPLDYYDISTHGEYRFSESQRWGGRIVAEGEMRGIRFQMPPDDQPGLPAATPELEA